MTVPSDILIRENVRGFNLVFHSALGLFSAEKIDSGTKLLLDSLEVNQKDICLDLGCGYGVIGIVLSKLNPTGMIYFADRDFLAIEYAKKNCEVNNVKNFEAVLSNGFSHLRGLTFNLIVSHLPTHVSNKLLAWIIEDAKNHLAKNGKLYVVTVSALQPFVKREFERVFGNYAKIAHNNLYSVSEATDNK